MAKIYIDPGHGDHDPGALGKYSKEKDNVLKVALKLKSYLEAAGHQVRLSRSTDKYLTLAERARLANTWGADYFISLHNNAATSTVSGFETFIHNGPVQAKTPVFQNAIHAAIIKEIGIRDRGKKRANFAVLRLTKMPAVLVEYAFISNLSDERLLMNEVDKMARLTANGIINVAGGKVPTSPKPPTPTTPKEEKKLELNAREREELAKVFTKAREEGIFQSRSEITHPSADHEKNVLDGTMTVSRSVYLLGVIAGAGMNDGKRV